ncbi:MAG: T9SS type A sorting domain-containing protein [Flavobacterium sp.]|nr:T9SS type A sorting domain-containing protein [Flavobacterium sp.]
MKQSVYIFVFFLSHVLFAQPNNQLWKGYFSYNEIVDVTGGTGKILAATQNAVFTQITASSETDLYNSITGFKPESITALHYSETTRKIYAGNANGLLLVIQPDGSVTTKVDIINEVPVAPNKKKINDLYEHNGRIYLATDYGISVVDASTLEFISTYFIGTAGEETAVLQTTVLGNEIYAVTRDFGIRKATVSNPNLFDFNQWQTFTTGTWTGIVTFFDQIVAMNADAKTYKFNGTLPQVILNQTQPGLKLKTNGSELIITTMNHVFVLNQVFTQRANITSIPDFSAAFTAATVVGNKIYIGTQKDGLFSTDLTNPTVFENLSPNGPLQNYIFRVKKAPNLLWTVYGDYTFDYNPFPLDELGISNYDPNLGWKTIPYSDVLEAKCLSDLAINPLQPNNVFISSYFSGVLELTGETIFLHDATNSGPSGLEPFTPQTWVLNNSPAFDKNGNLWVTNRGTDKALKVLRTSNQWQSYDIGDYITNGRFAPMAIDKNETKWLPTRDDGVIAFNDTQSNKTVVINTESGLPSTNVLCVAVDNRNQLWIGTAAGLRVLSSVDQFLRQNELNVSSIIIQEGDLAQELFYQQLIIDIAVDGANRKWVAIENGGVFLVAADGQETIYRFDTSNSPLPSNTVNDIEIDGVSGEVFFATDKGMVSFLGTSTQPSDNLADVYVYPNPVRPGFSGTVKISGLTDKATVKITDIEGNLVYETTTAGGTIEWDTTAFGKYKVASGVYMIFVSSEDGLQTTVKKVMIIR